MCHPGVLVHRLGRLGAAVAVLAAELLCGDGVFTKRTLERAKAAHHFDGVVSHSFKYSRLFRYDSELKLPSAFVTNGSRCEGDSSALTFVEAVARILFMLGLGPTPPLGAPRHPCSPPSPASTANRPHPQSSSHPATAS